MKKMNEYIAETLIDDYKKEGISPLYYLYQLEHTIHIPMSI